MPNLTGLPTAPDGAVDPISEGDDYLQALEQWMKDTQVTWDEGPLNQRPVIDGQNQGTGRRVWRDTGPTPNHVYLDVVTTWLRIFPQFTEDIATQAELEAVRRPPNLTIESTNPVLDLVDTDAPADARWLRLRNWSGVLYMQQIDDAAVVKRNAFTVGTDGVVNLEERPTYDGDGLATLASPAFAGNPSAPTQSTANKSTRLANTEWVKSLAADTAPVMNGAAAVGEQERYARQDHRHPVDTSRASQAAFDAFAASSPPGARPPTAHSHSPASIGALASLAPDRIVGGVVNGNGTINLGQNFTVERTGVGSYILTLDPGFTSVPTTQATNAGVPGAIPRIGASDSAHVEVFMERWNGSAFVLVDSAFTFKTMGAA